MSEQGDAAQDRDRREPVRVRRRLGRRALLRIGGVALSAAAGAGGYALLTPGAQPPPRRYGVPPAPDLLVRDVTVVDPLDGSATPGSSVLVRGGRIAEVGPTAGARGAAVEVDGAGRFAVPGYQNMHSHALDAERPELLLATMLAEGVTGFRQMAGSPEQLADRAARRLPLGVHAPGLLAAPGTVLTPLNAGSPADAVAEIAAQQGQGADFIKIVAVSREVFLAAVAEARGRGLPTAGHLPGDLLPSEAAAAGFTCVEHMGTGTGLWIECSARADELRERARGLDTSGLPGPAWLRDLPGGDLLAMARLRGRLVNPTAYTPEDVRALAQDALDSFDPQRCRALARTLAGTGTWQVPTLVRLRTQERADAPEYSTTDPWLARMTDAQREGWRASVEHFRGLAPEFRRTFARSYATRLRVVGIWHAAGVPMMTGTDGQGAAPGQSLRQEFAELSAAGLAPLELLRMATTAPAQFLGRSDRAGRVAPGADADLLLLDADPLASAGNLSRVGAVVRGGHLVTAEELAATIADLADRPADPRAEPAPACC